MKPLNVIGHEEIISEALAATTPILEQVQWAEDEIRMAQRTWPEAGDRLFHAFPLIQPPPHRALRTEPVYRAYARELLCRLARNEDTRPATAIEGCLVLRDLSLRVPLSGPAIGLYLRLWREAGMTELFDRDMNVHYESLVGSQIDEHERDLRSRAARHDRVFARPRCDGLHHGQRTQCQFANQPVGEAPEVEREQ